MNRHLSNNFPGCIFQQDNNFQFVGFSSRSQEGILQRELTGLRTQLSALDTRCLAQIFFDTPKVGESEQYHFDILGGILMDFAHIDNLMTTSILLETEIS